jgi:acyl-CoA hydrolase
VHASTPVKGTVSLGTEVNILPVAIEADAPLSAPGARPAADLYQAIGERVAALIPVGATLQLGIGAVPDAVLPGGQACLTVWSEMFSDGGLIARQPDRFRGRRAAQGSTRPGVRRQLVPRR